jgi:DNA-binding response OmpR family regulator
MPAMLSSTTKNSPGRDFLEHRSRVNKAAAALGPISRVLVVEDKPSDAALLVFNLQRIVGDKTAIEVATTERDLAAALKRPMPELLFLDDLIDRRVSANKTVPLIRRAGYTGPIIVVAAVMTRERSLELLRLSVSDVVHKDDLTSTRLREAILRVMGSPPDGQGPLTA